MKQILTLIAFVATALPAFAQVSGTVFRDFNANGVKDNSASFNEPFVAGVTVTAYTAAGTPTVTTTDASGAYAFTGLTLPLRIEFTGLLTGDYTAPSGSSGTANGSSVQFYAAASTSANFAVNYPFDYTPSNPSIILPRYLQGHQMAGPAANETVLMKFPLNNTGEFLDPAYPAPQNITAANQIGTVHGLAYYRPTASIFASAYLRYAAGFGPGGPGAIYKIDTFGVASTFLTLSAGTDPHPNNADFVVSPGSPPSSPTTETGTSTESLIGKLSLGDLDLDEETNTLYAINMFDKSLYKMPIGAGGTAPLPASIITIPIPNSLPIGAPSVLGNVTGGDLRPMAIGIRRGKIYVGIMGTAESTGSQDDLWAWVLEFDPATNTFLSTPVMSFSMKYDMYLYGFNFNYPHSRPWLSYADDPLKPQMIFSDIDFDGEDMVLGFRQRNSDMTDNPQAGSNGDILRACKTGSTWTIVSASNCGTTPSSFQTLTDDDPVTSTGEYYQDVFAPSPFSQVNENGQGSLLQLPGHHLLTTAGDPLTHAQTNGVYQLDNTTGEQLNKYETSFYYAGLHGYSFGKSSGLGDLEAVRNPAPLEIGNRVWSDANKNGIQDAGEAGIGSISIQLYQGATQVGTTTSNVTDGTWYFNNSNVNLNGATGLLPNTAYTIRIAAAAIPSGKTLSTANAGGAGQPDVRDSDASMVSGNVEIAYTTGAAGANDHTLDMGFMPPCTLTATASKANDLTCATPTALLTANSTPATGVTYAWSNSATTQTTTVNTANTYTVTVTETATGCMATATVTVANNIVPPACIPITVTKTK